MRKYRLTKINFKTREIITVSRPATSAGETKICPVCHAPIPASAGTLNESPAVKSLNRQSTTELLSPAASVSERHDEPDEGD